MIVPERHGGRDWLFHPQTAPGCILYERARAKVLDGADGVIVVLDAKDVKLEENVMAMRELARGLRQWGHDPRTFPILLQYNKRDLPNTLDHRTLDHYLNAGNWPVVEAAAMQGVGVIEAFEHICQLVVAGER